MTFEFKHSFYESWRQVGKLNKLVMSSSHLLQVLGVVTSIEKEINMVIVKGWRQGNGGIEQRHLMMINVTFCRYKVLKISCARRWIFLTLLVCCTHENVKNHENKYHAQTPTLDYWYQVLMLLYSWWLKFVEDFELLVKDGLEGFCFQKVWILKGTCNVSRLPLCQFVVLWARES